MALIAGAAHALTFLQKTKRSTPKQAIQHVSSNMDNILKNIYMEENKYFFEKHGKELRMAVIAGASHAVKFVPTHSDFNEEALIKKVSDSAGRILREID